MSLSPTLSTRSSVQFAPQTSVALRHNHPEQSNDTSTLDLLSPHYNGQRRKGSFASSAEGSNDGTEPDTNGLSVLTPQHTRNGSTIALPTQTLTVCPTPEQPSASTRAPAARAMTIMRREERSPTTRSQRRVLCSTSRRTRTSTPVHSSYRLASLVDPKNLNLLKQMGGIDGLMEGLGTHGKSGRRWSRRWTRRTTSPSRPASTKTIQVGLEQESVRRSATIETRRRPPVTYQNWCSLALETTTGAACRQRALGSDLGEEVVEEARGSGPVYGADLEERRRVFGANVLPTRETKSLLQLMQLALKDKVLVRYTPFYVFSGIVMTYSSSGASVHCCCCFACSVSQDFGTPRPDGEPPVD